MDAAAAVPTDILQLQFAATCRTTSVTPVTLILAIRNILMALSDRHKSSCDLLWHKSVLNTSLVSAEGCPAEFTAVVRSCAAAAGRRFFPMFVCHVSCYNDFDYDDVAFKDVGHYFAISG